MAWALYEWAQQPHWVLIATFIFTPYFASGFVGDAARGQGPRGYAGAVSGLLIAVFGPLVGASVDARRNPRIWLVGRMLPILICLVVAGVSAELTGPVMNALLPLVAKPGQIGFIAFGGVLAAGMFGWTTTQLGLYAIALSVMAGIGAFIGGRVDQKRGSKTTVLIASGVVLFVGPTFGPAQASLRAWMAQLARRVKAGGGSGSTPCRPRRRLSWLRWPSPSAPG